jgi:hypothetical protein
MALRLEQALEAYDLCFMGIGEEFSRPDAPHQCGQFRDIDGELPRLSLGENVLLQSFGFGGSAVDVHEFSNCSYLTPYCAGGSITETPFRSIFTIICCPLYDATP